MQGLWFLFSCDVGWSCLSRRICAKTRQTARKKKSEYSYFRLPCWGAEPLKIDKSSLICVELFPGLDTDLAHWIWILYMLICLYLPSYLVSSSTRFRAFKLQQSLCLSPFHQPSTSRYSCVSPYRVSYSIEPASLCPAFQESFDAAVP